MVRKASFLRSPNLKSGPPLAKLGDGNCDNREPEAYHQIHCRFQPRPVLDECRSDLIGKCGNLRTNSRAHINANDRPCIYSSMLIRLFRAKSAPEFPLWRIILLALLFGNVPLALSQDQGPTAPPPKFEVNRIPAVPHPGPPPIPVEQIIQKFAVNEDSMKKAFEAYDYTQTVRVEELDDPGGKLTIAGEVYGHADGSRFWRVKGQLESTLKSMRLSLEEVRQMIGFPEFTLTSDEIGNYNFLYAGQDKLDELNTYVFQVKPKQLSRTRRFFEGAIWVDDHDLAIVKTYGKFVSELSGNGTGLPFKMFETYRENFQEKYWLPTYTNSDDYIDGPDNTQTHLRLVIRDTDFKFAAAPTPPTSSAAGTPPAEQSGSSPSSVPVPKP
jgi:hypothetical protein